MVISTREYKKKDSIIKKVTRKCLKQFNTHNIARSPGDNDLKYTNFNMNTAVRLPRNNEIQFISLLGSEWTFMIGTCFIMDF